MKKDVTIDKIKDKISPVLRDHDVAKAGIFGSFARGENGKKSDLDVVVEFKGQKSLLDLAGLKIALEEMLEMKVDVLTYNSLNRLIKRHIMKELVPIL